MVEKTGHGKILDDGMVDYITDRYGRSDKMIGLLTFIVE